MAGIFLSFIGILFVAAVGVFATFKRDLAYARSRLVGRSKVIETPLGTLEYAVIGEGEPLLVVHGAGGGFDQGIDFAGMAAGIGYKLIAPSRFGYLRSALPRNPTTAMQADAYVLLLDHLGIDKVAVISISAGVWSSLHFAIRHPERCRAMILIVPADYLPTGTSIHGGAVVRAIIKSNFVAWAALKLMPLMPDVMILTMLGTDVEVFHEAAHEDKTRVRQVLERLLPVNRRLGGMQFDIKTAAVREPYNIENIACPILTVSAEDDRFGTAGRAKYIADNVSDGRSIIFPTGGHALIGHYADIIREITSFLQAI